MNTKINIEISESPEDMEAEAHAFLAVVGGLFDIALSRIGEMNQGAGVNDLTDERHDDWTGMYFSPSGWINLIKTDSPAHLSGIMLNDHIHAIDGMIVCRESHRKWTRSIASTQAGEPLFVDIVCPVSVNPAGFKRHILRRPGPAGQVS